MNNIIHNNNIYKSVSQIKRIFPLILGDDKINMTEVIALRNIAKISRTEFVNSTIIFENMWINKSAMSQMLNSLETNGYIIRARSEVDRRRVDLCITEKGINIVDKVKIIINELNQKIYDKFSEEKAILLEQMLNDYGESLGECLDEIRLEKGDKII